MELTQEQIRSIAQLVANKYETIVAFYNNPQNEQEYREWYFKKYGTYPKEKTK